MGTDTRDFQLPVTRNSTGSRTSRSQDTEEERRDSVVRSPGLQGCRSVLTVQPQCPGLRSGTTQVLAVSGSKVGGGGRPPAAGTIAEMGSPDGVAISKAGY